MNLQENIRRILREEINESLFFRRRVDMDLLNKRAFENLNDATDTFLKRYNQGQKFKFFQFKSLVIDYLMDDYHNELSKGGSKDFPYDEVYEYLSKYYHDKIKDRYELMFGGNINESIEKTNYLEILKEIVEPFKEDDGVCDIDMWYDDEDDMYSVYLVFGTEELNDKFTRNGKFVYVRKKQKEVKETIKSYLPIDNLFVGSYGKPNCGWKTLNESKDKLNEIWHEVPSSEYNSLQNIINLVMKEKYGWWKDIKINTLNYIETYGDVHIDAELTVDEEWGAKHWRGFYYGAEFPGNKGWEDDGYAVVRFGDIIDSTYAEVIRHDLKELLKYTLNIDANNISFLYVYLIFE